MSKVIGIDLGTTNSVVAVVEGGEPKVITNEEGKRTTPSVVSYSSDGERLVGDPARRQAVMNPTGTVFSIKRFMGMKFSEMKNEVGKVPYTICSGKDGACNIEVNGKKLAAPEISAQVLLKLKRAAEKYLGAPVTKAVITVPAYFNDAQRQATKDAGRIAGLEVERIINEPTAAALAYGLDKKTEQKVVVFDLGGGTFDVSILDIDGNVIEVLSTNGDTHLGGDDIDQVLMEWLVGEFKSQTGVDISTDAMALQRVREAAEKGKIELSSTQKTDINLPFLTANASGPQHLQSVLSRSKFEQMIEPLVKKTLAPLKSALSDAKLAKDAIDQIILVGGSTRIPMVRKSVEDFFGKESNNSVNPDEVVALGAAVQGGVFTGDVTDVLLLDVTPLSLGIETLGGVTTKLIERNTTIPCNKSETFSTAGDNQAAVDIHVLQGEREFASDNRTLGNFRLDGIPPAPRGVPQIEVSFDIDANGIVNVSAKDKATGKEQSIRIEGTGSLSESDIKQMVDDAAANEESDKQKKVEITSRNELDNLAYQSEKMLAEHREKASEEAVTELQAAVDAGRDALSNGDIDTIVRAKDHLQQVMAKFGTELYNQSAEENPATASEPEVHTVTPDDVDVVDAEFTQEQM